MKKTFSEYRDEYLEYLKVIKNYSPHTIISYSNDLIQFSDYILKSENLKSDSILNLKKLDAVFLKSFIAELADPSNQKRYSKKTISRKISVIKSFYRFLVKKKYISKNYSSSLNFPKLQKRLPSFLTESELENLLGKKYLMEISIQDKALLELFYSTGIRLSELINLKIENIDFKNKTIKVFGKGSKERIVPSSNFCVW